MQYGFPVPSLKQRDMYDISPRDPSARTQLNASRRCSCDFFAGGVFRREVGATKPGGSSPWHGAADHLTAHDGVKSSPRESGRTALSRGRRGHDSLTRRACHAESGLARASHRSSIFVPGERSGPTWTGRKVQEIDRTVPVRGMLVCRVISLIRKRLRSLHRRTGV